MNGNPASDQLIFSSANEIRSFSLLFVLPANFAQLADFPENKTLPVSIPFLVQS